MRNTIFPVALEAITFTFGEVERDDRPSPGHQGVELALELVGELVVERAVDGEHRFFARAFGADELRVLARLPRLIGHA